MTDNEMIDSIIRREGRQYTNYPADKGGPTKFGITLATLSGYRGKPCVASDVEALEEPEARAIYTQLYVAPFAKITNWQVRNMLTDIGVNSGPRQAILLLQKTLGVKADGVLGPVTLAAANKVNPKSLVRERLLFYADIVLRDSSQRVFLDGWINRALEFV